jgi:hypothetical protein
MIEEVGEVSAGDLLDLGPVEVLGQHPQVTGVRGDGVLAGALADETPLEPLDRFVDQHRCLLVNGLLPEASARQPEETTDQNGPSGKAGAGLRIPQRDRGVSINPRGLRAPNESYSSISFVGELRRPRGVRRSASLAELQPRRLRAEASASSSDYLAD